MTWILVGLLGMVLGVLVGALVWRRRTPVQPAIATPESGLEPVLPKGVARVISALRSAAVVVGPDKQVLQSNPQARTLGLVRGARVVVPQVLEMIRTVRDGGQVRTAELELRRGGGSSAVHLTVRVALLDDLVLVLADDRTAARRVENTRRDFVANVSHELKTPIGAISLLAEAVEAAAEDPDAVRNFASRMSRESDRLSELVRQIIQLSRLQSDDPLMTAAVVDIDEVFESAVLRCAERAKSKHVTLAVAGEPGCRVMGDVEQLTTAVASLVENAIIYSETHQKVAIAARRTADADDNYVELIVSDTGIGIAAADLPRVFERFYRVDYARSRANGGTGLGLSIVKHIAGAHGGQVTVWSQPGQGSTFTLRIPEHLTKDAIPGADPDRPIAGSDDTSTLKSREVAQ